MQAARDLIGAELAGLNGDRSSVELSFRNALDRFPEEPYLRFAWARWLAREGRMSAALEEARWLVDRVPHESEFWRFLGRLEWSLSGEQREGLERALRAFDQIAAEFPDDFEVWSALGTIRFQLGDFAGAVPALEVAVRLRPELPGLELMRARALVKLGRRREGVEAYQRLLELDPQALGPRLEYAEQLVALGQPDLAVLVLDSLPATVSRGPEIRRRLASYRWVAGDLEGARREASELLKANPADVRLRGLLAWIERSDGRFEEGMSWLEPLLDNPSVPTEVFQLYFELAERSGQADRAEMLMSRWLDLAHRSGDPQLLGRVWQSRIGWYLRQAKFDQVLDELDRALPHSLGRALEPLPSLWAAEALVGLGRRSEALERLLSRTEPRARVRALELAEELDQSSEIARLERGLRSSLEGRAELAASLQRNDRHAEALPLLEALVSDGLTGVGWKFRLGIAYERTGFFEKAVSTFESLIADVPDFAPALNYLGYLWIERRERLEEALELVVRAVRLEPDNGAYVDSLGWGYYQMGKIPLAVKFLERAARLSPADPTILEHLGDALLAAGDRERARAIYRRALEAPTAPREALIRKLELAQGAR